MTTPSLKFRAMIACTCSKSCDQHFYVSVVATKIESHLLLIMNNRISFLIFTWMFFRICSPVKFFQPKFKINLLFSLITFFISKDLDLYLCFFLSGVAASFLVNFLVTLFIYSLRKKYILPIFPWNIYFITVLYMFISNIFVVIFTST